MEEMVRANGGCETPVMRDANSTLVGPQFCGQAVPEMYQDYALDPMNYQSKMQFMKISEGIFTSKNKYAQFNITNNEAALTRIYRVGGFISLTGNYLNFGVPAGASDFATVSDDYGTNVKKTQGFSMLTIGKPMIITQLRVVSSSVTQLAQPWSYQTINPDMTITPTPINLLATEAKSDQRTNLQIAYGVWILNTNHYLETQALATVPNAFSLLLEVSGVQNVSDFVQL